MQSAGSQSHQMKGSARVAGCQRYCMSSSSGNFAATTLPGRANSGPAASGAPRPKSSTMAISASASGSRRGPIFNSNRGDQMLLALTAGRAPTEFTAQEESAHESPHETSCRHCHNGSSAAATNVLSKSRLQGTELDDAIPAGSDVPAWQSTGMIPESWRTGSCSERASSTRRG